MISWRLERHRLLDLRLMVGMLLPLLAGVAAFGWRALGTIFLVTAGAIAGRYVLHRLRNWPANVTRWSLFTRGVLVALFLPPTMFDMDRLLMQPNALWPLAVAIGLTLSVLTWLVARAGTARVSPVVLTLLLTIVLSGVLSLNDRVLQPNHIFTGDLLSPHVVPHPTATAEPWLASHPTDGSVVRQVEPAARHLDDYLRARVEGDAPAVTIARLVSDDLPPLEDLVVIGHPRTLGAASSIAIVLGGLFLLHRRVVAFRVPAVMVITTLAALFVVPVPVIVSPSEVSRIWLAGHDPRVGWAMGVTFVNYVLMASPALLVIFFVAPLPGIRPLGGRAAMVYAALFGLLCGVLTSLVSLDFGALIAVGLAQLIAPSLERWLPPLRGC